ncbi:MAG: hypothetical protein IPK99_17735 [Flavobacteriales bacterium]|nr:hypothetical protein [Flavobacteriales bacterium]
MCFLPHGLADIIGVLEEHGTHPAAVLFVERHDGLHVQLPGRSVAFAFFRERSTKLDEPCRWQERVDYFIGMGKKEPCDRAAVIEVFGKWLL